MRGLQKQTDDDNKTFLLIKHGSICRESKTPRSGFDPVQVNNPRTGETITKYVEKYKSVEAMVTRLEWYDTADRYDARYLGWKLHLDAAGTPCVLDLPFESRACTRFMKCAENVDWTLPVEFQAFVGSDDKTVFVMRQNGELIRQRYTRDEPGDCPEPVKTMKGWNYDAQAQWLHQRMIDRVVPEIEEAQDLVGSEAIEPARAPHAHAQAAAAGSPSSETYREDDIPF